MLFRRCARSLHGRAQKLISSAVESGSTGELAEGMDFAPHILMHLFRILA